MAFERIAVDPDVMAGVPCIRGTRVPVATVLGQLAGDFTIDEVLSNYPYLEREDVLEALRFAVAVVSGGMVTAAWPA